MKSLSLFALMFFFAASASSPAAVSIKANAPPISGYITLPNAYHQIDFIVTDGKTNRVNLEAPASVTLKCFPASAQIDPQHCRNSLALVGVTAGSTTGKLSWNNATKPATLSGTSSFRIHAVSVDDPSQSADAVFLIAAITTEVHIFPMYQQLYSGQMETVRCQVHGNADYRCAWTVAGAGCSLSTTTEIATQVTHTGAGTCSVKATSKADPSKSAVSQIGFVAESAPVAVTPEFTRPLPCQTDPDRAYKTVLDIGPSKPHTRLSKLPLSKDSTLYRVFNESTSPDIDAATSYHDNFQIKGSHVRLCGVANAAGVLPVIDCSAGAVSPSWADAPGGQGSGTYGCISVKTNNYTRQSDVIIEGLHVKGAQSGDSYVAPDGSTAKRDDAQNIRVQNSWGFLLAGNDIENGSSGIFLMDNPGFGWHAVTRDGLLEYNYLHGNGNAKSNIDHQVYAQTDGFVFQYNKMGTPAKSAGGFQLKVRSVESVIDGNVIWDFGRGNGQRCIDWVELQDSSVFVSPMQYVYNTFSTKGDQEITPDQIAAGNDRLQRDRAQGNFCRTDGLFPYHYSDDHGSGGDAGRTGKLFFFYNTQAMGAFGFLRAVNPAGDAFPNPYYRSTIKLKNNILLTNRPASDPAFAIGADLEDIFDFGRNLYLTGTFNLKTPIHPAPGSQGPWRGFGGYSSESSRTWEAPMDLHLEGLTPSNFLFTTAQTVSGPQYAAPKEGRGQALPLTGEDAYDLPRYSMNPDTAILTPRTAYTDLGAVQTSDASAAHAAPPRPAAPSRPVSR